MKLTKQTDNQEEDTDSVGKLETINFDGFDKLQRIDFAKRLEKVIFKLAPFYSESFVLSLHAKYGCGKTTFLKMWEERLKSKETSQACEVITINAWESDFDEEPLIHILDALLRKIGTTSEGGKIIMKSIQGIMGASASAVDQAAAALTGVSVKKALEDGKTAAMETDDICVIGERLYQNYSFKKQAYKELNLHLRKHINETKKTLFIFIDELDRVRPSYAIKFLETIKHFFNIKGICFVIAVDKDQLEKSVQQLYGDIDFQNYYLRFITREAVLPTAQNLDLAPYIKKLGEDYIDEKSNVGIHIPINSSQKNDIISFITRIAKCLDINARQMEYYFRIFSQFLVLHDEGKFLHDCQTRCIALLIGVFVTNEKLYHKLGAEKNLPSGSNLLDEIVEYCKYLKFNNPTRKPKDDLFLSFIAFSYNDSLNKHSYIDTAERHFRKLYYNDSSGEVPELTYQIEKQLCQIVQIDDYDGFKYIDKSSFSDAYERLEEWRSFIY
ncbi:MAG: AAA family ATPase [Alphaproteobacteria bacterium]|nr:AAA family ATPase [Alphaproteobacteria bacterium]NCQ89284.1 AAA family ATPase [Alphaproteobacteria bacterium]NCT08148.1 AAA family ATPase [Alphaproteobacteria bacterium]